MRRKGVIRRIVVFAPQIQLFLFSRDDKPLFVVGYCFRPSNPRFGFRALKKPLRLLQLFPPCNPFFLCSVGR